MRPGFQSPEDTALALDGSDTLINAKLNTTIKNAKYILLIFLNE